MAHEQYHENNDNDNISVVENIVILTVFILRIR